MVFIPPFFSFYIGKKVPQLYFQNNNNLPISPLRVVVKARVFIFTRSDPSGLRVYGLGSRVVECRGGKSTLCDQEGVLTRSKGVTNRLRLSVVGICVCTSKGRRGHLRHRTPLSEMSTLGVGASTHLSLPSPPVPFPSFLSYGSSFIPTEVSDITPDS